MPFLRQHAPAEELLRSAVLARATREISIITQRGLAASFLAAEPRTNVVQSLKGPGALPVFAAGHVCPSEPPWGLSFFLLG